MANIVRAPTREGCAVDGTLVWDGKCQNIAVGVLELSVTLNLGEGEVWGTRLPCVLCPDGEQRGGCGGTWGLGWSQVGGKQKQGLHVGLSAALKHLAGSS